MPDSFSSYRTGAASVDPGVVAQAADWLVLLQSGADAMQHEACLRWRAMHPAHELAWQRMQAMTRDMQAGASVLEPAAAAQTLARVCDQAARRQHLKWMLGVAGAGVLAWSTLERGGWHLYTADYRTATGERRDLVLADGTRLILNTASAVGVRFDSRLRMLTLRAGEIFVETGRDPAGRPLQVSTASGTITPIGTRYTVRELDTVPRQIQVAVLQGAVELRPRYSTGVPTMLLAGQQTRFDEDRVIPPSPLSLAGDAWIDGSFAADRMRLAEVVAELARYRPGILNCDPGIADLLVTGTFPTADTDMALNLLTQILPVRLKARTRYWVTVSAK